MDRQTVEEMILTMADIVMENRYLREEVVRLRKVEKECYHYINKTAREGEKACRDIIRTPLNNILMIVEEKQGGMK
ncbi:MAG: hypothetical protein J1E98_11805 [Lachnospiraceae bacterium]|nr:hypothetical protein [Lachnospiraceae bacterium]